MPGGARGNSHEWNRAGFYRAAASQSAVFCAVRACASLRHQAFLGAGALPGATHDVLPGADVVPVLVWLVPGLRIPLEGWPTDLPTAMSLTASLTAQSTGTQAPSAAFELSVATALVIAYALVAGFLLLRLAAHFYLSHREVTRYPLQADVSLNHLLDELRHDLGIEQPVELRAGSASVDLHAWGIHKQVIVIPTRFPICRGTYNALCSFMSSSTFADATPLHAIQAICCLYWINPSIWFLNRQLKLEMEKSCDDSALTFGIAPAD